MEAYKEIKDLGIDWEKNQSKPIYALPFNLNRHLQIIENENKVYFKFDHDDEEKFIIPIKDKEDFIKKYNFYTQAEIKNDQDSPMVRIMKNMNRMKLTDPSTLFSKDKIKFYFSGIVNGMTELENGCTFNNFLCFTPLRQSTAFWTRSDDPKISVYKTFFSHSIIGFDMFEKAKLEFKDGIFYPLIVMINYDEIDGEIPKDVMASLKDLNLRDKDQVKEDETFSFMYDILKNYEEYI